MDREKTEKGPSWKRSLDRSSKDREWTGQGPWPSGPPGEGGLASSGGEREGGRFPGSGGGSGERSRVEGQKQGLDAHVDAMRFMVGKVRLFRTSGVLEDGRGKEGKG